MSLSSLHFISSPLWALSHSHTTATQVGVSNPASSNLSINAQKFSEKNSHNKRVWRRRKLLEIQILKLMSLSSLHFISSPLWALSHSHTTASQVGVSNPASSNLSINAQKFSEKNSPNKRVWRRRKLTKKDDMLRYKMDRIPFLEEKVRKIKEAGKLLTKDIERLLLSEENRFDFVNEIAAEAREYVENDRDAYGGSKKAILHVLSNRVNDAGFSRPEAYVDPDPYKPGPNYLREEHL